MITTSRAVFCRLPTLIIAKAYDHHHQSFSLLFARCIARRPRLLSLIQYPTLWEIYFFFFPCHIFLGLFSGVMISERHMVRPDSVSIFREFDFHYVSILTVPSDDVYFHVAPRGNNASLRSTYPYELAVRIERPSAAWEPSCLVVGFCLCGLRGYGRITSVRKGVLIFIFSLGSIDAHPSRPLPFHDSLFPFPRFFPQVSYSTGSNIIECTLESSTLVIGVPKRCCM